jgi:hypothetical protein
VPEFLAGGILSRAGLAGSAKPHCAVVAARLFGVGAVRFVTVAELHGFASRSLRGPTGWRIELHESLPPEEWSIEVAYHVAGICLAADRQEIPHALVNQVARAIVVPRAALLHRLAEAKVDAAHLAVTYATTEQVVWERLEDLRLDELRRFDD